MSYEDSYGAIYFENYNVLIFSKEYLELNSEKSKKLLLEHGYCPDCKKSFQCFETCNCKSDAEKYSNSWFAAISDDVWQIVEESLERDRLRIKAKISATLRKDKFKYCAGFHRHEDIEAIRIFQKNTCYFCGANLEGCPSQIDHLTSITNQGSEWPSNLAITCVTCNRRKSSSCESDFWLKQKKKLGAEFIKNLRGSRASERSLKKKLDRVRVKELKQQLASFEDAINVKLSKEGYPEIELEIENDGILFSFDNFSLKTLPCSHRKIFQWSTEDVEKWVRPLLEINLLTKG